MTLSEIMSIVNNAQSLSNVETKHHLKSVKTLLDGVFVLSYFHRIKTRILMTSYSMKDS